MRVTVLALLNERRVEIFMRESIIIYPFSKFIGFGFILLSCTTVTPILRPSSSEPIQKPKLSVSVSETEWLPKQIVGHKEYFIHDSSTISISGDSSQTRMSNTNTIYIVRLSKLNNSLLTSKADSLKMRPQSFQLKIAADTEVIKEFEAIMSPTGQISSLSGHFVPLCPGGITPVAARIQDLILSYPERGLKVGDSWTDTVSTTVCHGRISLLQQSIYVYRFLSFSIWKQHLVVIIQRDVLSTFTADTKNSRNYFTATGSGTSFTTIYANRLTGALLQSDTHLESALTVSTPRGVFPFTQSTVTHIELQ